MKGLIVTADHTVQLVDDIPMPEIGPYEALVRIDCCMICNGTDMEILCGQLPEAAEYPLMLGHESAGHVIRIGEKVRSFQPGDQVIRACLPSNARYASSWGSFSEYGVVLDYAAAAADGLPENRIRGGMTQQKVDARISPEVASLMITLKETYSALVRVGASRADTIVILGDGPVGLSMLYGCGVMGIQNVTIIGNHRENLECAEKLGARQVVWAKDAAQLQQVQTELGGQVSLFIDTVGTAQTIAQGRGFLSEDGLVAVYGLRTGSELTLPLAGSRNFGLRFVQWPVQRQEYLAHEPITQAILHGKLDPELLISHRYPLSAFAEGFEQIRKRQARKVVLYMHEEP